MKHACVAQDGERDGERPVCTQAEGGFCPSRVVAVLFMLLDFS